MIKKEKTRKAKARNAFTSRAKQEQMADATLSQINR